MTISLYDSTVTNFVQTLGAMEGFLAKGLAHFRENKIDPNEIVETRLYADMLPFRFQVVSAAHHALGDIRGAQAGEAGPPPPSTLDYAGLQTLVADTIKGLQQLKPAEVNALEGKDVMFKVRDTKLPFTADGFLYSFALPNFYFHATTAYDILRMKGVPLGKRDFMGRMRMKT
jgi:hypothetical protein